jgi:hypothetical protein
MIRIRTFFVLLLIAGAPQFAHGAPSLSVRIDIGARLSDALNAIHKMDFPLALQDVQLADKTENKTPFEEYSVAQYLAFIALNQPMPDYAAARTAYGRIIASGGIPDRDKSKMQDLAAKLRLGIAP